MTIMKELSGPANGELWGHAARDWAEIQERTLEPVFDYVLERATVGSQTRYLDLGCGAGLAVEKALALGATATGLDAAAALLEIARERAPAARFDLGDLEVLPYEDGSFDVVTGFNSFQYAANPAQAMKEAARVACAGATIVIATWGEPEGMDAAEVVSALKSVLPPPAPDTPGPFALSAPGKLAAFAASGGLETIEMMDVESPWMYPDFDTALRGLASSGVAARAIRHAGRAAVDEAHAKAAAPYRRSDGSYHIGATFKVCFTRPARS